MLKILSITLLIAITRHQFSIGIDVLFNNPITIQDPNFSKIKY